MASLPVPFPIPPVDARWHAARAALREYWPATTPAIHAQCRDRQSVQVDRAVRHLVAGVAATAALVCIALLADSPERAGLRDASVVAALVSLVWFLRALLTLRPAPHDDAGWLCSPLSMPDLDARYRRFLEAEPEVAAAVDAWREHLGQLRMVERLQIEGAFRAWCTLHSRRAAGSELPRVPGAEVP